MPTENFDITEQGGAEELEDSAPQLEAPREESSAVHNTDSIPEVPFPGAHTQK